MSKAAPWEDDETIEGAPWEKDAPITEQAAPPSLGKRAVDFAGDILTFGAGDVLARPFQAGANALGQVEDAALGVIPAGRRDAEKYFTPRNVASAAFATPATLARGVSQFGADLLKDPLPTSAQAVKSVVTSPARAYQGFRDSAEAAKRGDARTQIRRFGEGLAAASEPILVTAPVAGRIAGRAASGAAEAALETAVDATATKPAQQAVQRLQQADPNLLESAQNAQRLRDQGVPATTADVLPRNAQSVVKGAARRPGPGQEAAQQALDVRQAGQVVRLTKAIDNAFGVEDDFLNAVKRIEEAKSAQATPLYEQAYSVPTPLTTELQQLMARPSLQRALKDVKALAAERGDTLNMIPGDLPVSQVRTATGQIRTVGDTKTLHYIRRALDDQIEKYRDPTTGKLRLDNKGRALVETRRKFNEAVRDANGAFKEADQVFSEGTSAEQAMQKGLRASKLTSERQVRQFMDDAIKAGDEELFRLGYAQGLKERIGRSGSDFSNRTLRIMSPESQATIKTVMGEEAGQAFLDRVAVENIMSQTRNRISPNVGSDTAENIQQTANLATSVGADLATLNPLRAFATVTMEVARRRLAGNLSKAQQAVDENIIRLTTEDPERLIQLIQEVQTSQRKGLPALPDFRPQAGATAVSGISDRTRRPEATSPPQ